MAASAGVTATARQLRVAYIDDAGVRHAANTIPVVRHRATLVHELIKAYRLHEGMTLVASVPATEGELLLFHLQDYVDYLRTARPDHDGEEHLEQEDLYGLGFDCPVLPGLWSLVCRLAGSSLTGARLLSRGEADIAINWCGGWHHAQKDSASGFCYVNDIVLAILELRQRFQRVVYIDLDVHHGDGVENAFAYSRSVLTVSVHLREDGFFPGTGGLEDGGYGEGKYCALNIPYRSGFSDQDLESVIRGLIANHLAVYHPDCLVIQCGGDALALDKLGGANLSIEGYQRALRLLLDLHRPTLLLGGGGYMRTNVSRLWTTLTATAQGATLDTEIPEHPYFEHYGPSFDLSLSISNRRNLNTPEHLQLLLQHIRDQCSELEKLLPRKVLRLVENSQTVSDKAPCYSVHSKPPPSRTYSDLSSKSLFEEKNKYRCLQNDPEHQDTTARSWFSEDQKTEGELTIDGSHPATTHDFYKNSDDWEDLMDDRLIRNWFGESSSNVISEEQEESDICEDAYGGMSARPAEEDPMLDSGLGGCGSAGVYDGPSSNELIFKNSRLNISDDVEASPHDHGSSYSSKESNISSNKRTQDSDVIDADSHRPRLKIFKSRMNLDKTEDNPDKVKIASSEYDFPDF